MKKLFLVFIISIFLFSCSKKEEVIINNNVEKQKIISTEVKNQDSSWWESNFNISSLIKDKDSDVTYSWTYLTWIILLSYNTNDFEKDILYTTTWWDLYDNSIQRFSKEKEFDKQKFLDLFENFKKWDYSLIKDSFEKDKNIIPFYPVCCAFEEYIDFQVYKNGILTIYKAWNGATWYSFSYITYKDWLIYSLSKDSWYSINAIITENIKKWDLYIDDKKISNVDMEEFDKEIISYFRWEIKNEVFNNKFDIFKKEVDTLYK